jgi:sirohydrochlorin ferrochelatase
VVARHVRIALGDNHSHHSPVRVIVAAAGTSDELARESFRAAVQQWAEANPDDDAIAAFIAGGAPDVGTAVDAAISAGLNPVVAPFTLAEGALTDRARADALAHGATVFLPALGAADEVVSILLARRDACATV